MSECIDIRWGGSVGVSCGGQRRIGLGVYDASGAGTTVELTREEVSWLVAELSGRLSRNPPPAEGAPERPPDDE